MSNSELQQQFAMDSDLADFFDQTKDKKVLAKFGGWLFVSRAIGMKAIGRLAFYFTLWGKAEHGFAAKFKAEMDRREKDGLFPDPFVALGFARP